MNRFSLQDNMSVIFILAGLLLTLPGHQTLYEDGSELTAEQKQVLDEIIRQAKLADYYARNKDQKFNKLENNDNSRNLGKENSENVDETNFAAAQEQEVNFQAQTTTTAKSPAENKTTQSHAPPLPPQPQVGSKHSEVGTVVLGKDLVFMFIVAACSIAGFIGLIMAGVCWYKLHKNVKAASEVEYPAYGVTGPTKERTAPIPGDRKLAQSAQMYHYQHQKQQMIAMEKANGEMKHDASEDESEEENEEGDYTVYECPGLAPTGEMEVRNPLFNEDTPSASGPEENKSENNH